MNKTLLRCLKPFLYLVVSLTVAAALYIFSFRTASIYLVDAKLAQYSLHIIGISVPFTPSRQSTFRSVYAPLLRWEADHRPKQFIRGTLRSIDWDSARVEIEVTGSSPNMSCRFDQQDAPSLHKLAEGSAVSATIGYTPGEFPGNYDYKLVAISQ